MAPWGDAKLFFCILFITCCCTVTLAQMPMDCCLTVINKNITKVAIVDYRQQLAGQGCYINATILVTRQDFHLCVPSNEPWVHDVVNHVDARKKHCKKTNYKGRRCFGMKRQ